jgi:hypothetical protein
LKPGAALADWEIVAETLDLPDVRGAEEKAAWRPPHTRAVRVL